MKALLSSLIIGFSFVVANLHAATNYVTPGESIQAAVNSSDPGDTIIIFGATYIESVTVDKLLTIQPLQGEEVWIVGNMTYQNIDASTNGPLNVSNLKIGSDTSRKLYINSCTNVVVNVDVTAGGGIDVNASGEVQLNDAQIPTNGGAINISTSSKVRVDNCQMASGTVLSCSNSTVWLGNSTLEGISTASSDVTVSRVVANSWIRANPNAVLNLLQATVTNSDVSVVGGTGRILYSRLHDVGAYSGAEVTAIGNQIVTDKVNTNSVRILTGAKAVIRNNEITRPAGGDGGTGVGNGIWSDSSQCLIANNYIHDLAALSSEGDDDRNGVYVSGSTGPVEITGNIFWGTQRAVYAPFDNVTYRYNNDAEGLGRHAGGVFSDNNIGVDPLFVDKAGGNYQLSTNSPCINMGPPEPRFNDRDGTRNDIGLFGGSAYDPEGASTDKPIAFGLEAAPFTVIKGIHTNITINGGGIVIGR